MRVVFMGSPGFAALALRALHREHEVVLVVTQPDKRAGRGKKVHPPAVKIAAEELGLPVVQPTSARPPAFAEELRATGAELAVVVAYGKILPKAVLDAFPLGCINIHASILPRHRGAAPIQWSIIEGDAEAGVCIMRLDEGMDTGPVLLTRRTPIGDEETSGELFERLAPMGAEAMLEAIEGLASGTLEAVAQDHTVATHAPMLKKSDGAVDWSRSAREVACLIRGVDPWPGAYTELDGDRLKLFRARVVEGAGAPGEVLAIDERGLVVACGEGACAITDVQAAGRKRMAARAYASGRAIAAGTVLTTPSEES